MEGENTAIMKNGATSSLSLSVRQKGRRAEERKGEAQVEGRRKERRKKKKKTETEPLELEQGEQKRAAMEKRTGAGAEKRNGI